MTAPVATAAQIKSFEKFVVRQWGGQGRIDSLFASSPAYERAFVDAVSGRYSGALELLVPWVKRLAPDMTGRRLFEVGCGTGSSTAAFATICESITAFDIEAGAVGLARDRLTCFGATNASAAEAADLSGIIQHLEAEERVDGVLLYAVLEHMYVHERIEILRRAWAKLSPGGVVIICETPNRLSYFDGHTFLQPFVNLLPPELAKLWAGKCVDDATRHQIEAIPADDYLKLRDSFVRIGQSGPSFHEFEIAIGAQVHEFIISGPFDREIDPFNGPYRLEQELLGRYMRERTPHVNPAFAMPILYFILQKPVA